LKDWHRFGPCARAEGRKLKKTAHAESMIGKLLSSVDDVTQTVDTIATLSMEQATNIQQVNRAVRQMDQVTQNNAALVEEAAAAADTMQMRARSLVESVEFFKLGESAAANGSPMRTMGSASSSAAHPRQLQAA
jgi:hypothetical protein